MKTDKEVTAELDDWAERM